jgi:AraC family transcriptional regulator of adaptative response / DNA-3-methyladenine glycosylase II
VIVDLPYQPPYDWDSLAEFVGARCIDGVEEINQSRYRRVARIIENTQAFDGWLEVAFLPRRHCVRVEVSASLEPVVAEVLSRLKNLLDLSCRPARVSRALGELAAARPGLRLPGAFDGFETAVRAVLGQQISVAAARTLARRLAGAFGTPVESPFASLTTAFPSAHHVGQLEAEELVHLGILASRARTILALARAIADGSICLAPGVDIAATLVALKSITGIG